MPWKLTGKRRKIVLGLLLVLLIGVVGVSIWGIRGGALRFTPNGLGINVQRQDDGGSSVSIGSHSGPGVTPTGPVSPLLFGTNLSLFDGNDQVLHSAVTRGLLMQMHTRIIRMPVRSSLSEAIEVQAAQTIKSLGAAPLLVLRGAVDTSTVADDTRIIADMNRIFGKSVVYYEYGNEEDLLGVDVNGYTASWNSVVPQLKRLALNGRFIGPVNFQYDRHYLSEFLKHANPRPDEVSWHEYTCDDAWASAICISHIDNWTRHISDARFVMQGAIGSVLPIMITEWNYAPNAVPNDGKNNDSAFMTTWTSKALQVLAANRVFASMQYSCTNTAIPMVADNGTPTMQGLAFQNQYQTMIVQGKQPVAIGGAPSGQPTPGATQAGGPPTTYLSFSFEDGGTDGWASHSGSIGVRNSGSLAQSGTHSLEVSLTNVLHNDYPYISVGQAEMGQPPQPGQTITAYVYVPSNSVSVGAELFVMDNAYHWVMPNSSTQLQPGVWNRLTFALSGSMAGPLRQVGMQFTNLAGTPMSVNVYVDAVSWG